MTLSFPRVFSPPRAALLYFAGTLGAFAAAAPPTAVRTLVYKRVGSLEIKADIHPPADDRRPHPVVVYLHGGSLINGSREAFARSPLKDLLHSAGFVAVSVDYRLAPESKLPAIIEDVEDAFRWVRTQGPELFGADPHRVIAAGGSAGGYLTLVAGFRIKPRPIALVAEMSYGDLIGHWQQRPSIHPPHYTSHLSSEEAWRQVSGPVVANSRDRRGDGGKFNDFVRRNASWPEAVSGWHPQREAAKYTPYLPVRHVTHDYPPTFLIHGSADTDVPPEQPELMAAEFRRHGVEHRLIFIPGAEHGYRGADPELVRAAHREALAFLKKHAAAATPH